MQAFVIVLACSRHMFVRPVLRMDATSWVAAHIAAWEFFGGYASVGPSVEASERAAWGFLPRSAGALDALPGSVGCVC